MTIKSKTIATIVCDHCGKTQDMEVGGESGSMRPTPRDWITMQPPGTWLDSHFCSPTCATAGMTTSG